MRATVCPRCARTSETWTFERDQGLAGCPCGEVIPYPVDDAPLEAVSKTPKKPRGWVEDARTNGFTATLRPNMIWLWYTLPLMLLLGGTRVAISGALLGGAIGLVLALVALAALMGWLVSQSVRRWTFAFENGRFRADARGHSTDIALEDIQRFDVDRRSPKRKTKTSDARALFELVVSRTNEERVRIPLFVDSDDEAQFIAERANTMLASDGRTIAGDYRGQHLRVAEGDGVRTRIEMEQEQDDETIGRAEDAEQALLRRTRTGGDS